MEKWIVVCGEYDGLEARGVNLLTAKMKEYLNYEISVTTAVGKTLGDFANNDLVVVGTLQDNPIIAAKYSSVASGDDEGYVVSVETVDGRNVVFIGGNTPVGAFYGVTDFLGEYLPTVAVSLSETGNFNTYGFFKKPFNESLPAYFKESAPAIKRRALWTWGYCIFDYEKYLSNAAFLKLNEIVIWNDKMPVNAKEVVEYAHGLGIKVIFGYSWGWDVACGDFNLTENLKEENVKAFADTVVDYYEKNVLPTGADGIYFQSFTELFTDNIGGVNIAEAVTAWVNGIAKEFYKKHQSVELQFGLHATSVKKHLQYIKNVDKRIKIIWEDCGAFPYNYSPAAVADFAETEEFTETITTLLGENERFGAVLKGMTTLYWDVFTHVDESFVLGRSSEESINALYEDRRPAWKYIQAEWIKNAEYMRKTVASIRKTTNGAADMQLLLEYGAFEKEIFFPVALYANTLWNPDEETFVLIEKTMLNPYVKFVN